MRSFIFALLFAVPAFAHDQPEFMVNTWGQVIYADEKTANIKEEGALEINGFACLVSHSYSPNKQYYGVVLVCSVSHGYLTAISARCDIHNPGFTNYGSMNLLSVKEGDSEVTVSVSCKTSYTRTTAKPKVSHST